MFICDISVFNKYGKQKLDEMLLPLKIDWRELIVMLVIGEMREITQARLAPFLQTDKANVTKMLQTMEKKGLIRREADGVDQRNKVCTLTSQGEGMVPQLRKILDLWEESCFQGIDKDELLIFRRIAETITQRLMNN